MNNPFTSSNNTIKQAITIQTIKNRNAHYFELVYTPEQITLYTEIIADQPWTTLLDSGSSDHMDSRFDILVSNPIITLETSLSGKDGNQANTKITQYHYFENEQYSFAETLLVSEQLSHYDPFELIDTQLKTCDFVAEQNEDMPFQGGALGFWSYDLGKTQEILTCKAPKIDNLPAMAIGIYDWALIADNKKAKLTLVLHAESNTSAEVRFHSIMRYLTTRRSQQSVNETKAEASSSFKLTQNWQSLISREEYGEKFRAIKDELLAGECYQVNLTQGFTSHYAGNEWEAYKTLTQANKAPFSAFMRLDKHVVLSASPERFISVIDQQISTKPIKGTLPKLGDPKLDEQQMLRLARSEKNQSENLMIVDLLRNDIGKVAVPGSVSVPKLFAVESFPAVHHLVSTITAELPSNISSIKLLQRCFPGGSITGAPKISAMKIIDKLEHSQRSLYCGSIGYISVCGKMDTNIAIRTIIAEKSKPDDDSGRLFCWAGGGIVAESEEQDEYEESLAKLGKILSLWE